MPTPIGAPLQHSHLRLPTPAPPAPRAATRADVLGEGHVWVAYSRIDLALAYEADGQIEQARKTLELVTLPINAGPINARI